MNTKNRIKVRDAHKNDIPKITEIYAHHVIYGLASFEEIPPEASEMLARFKEICDAGYPYHVAEIDNQVVGYAYAVQYRARPAYRHSVENSVYVDPSMTGRKIGSALLQATIEGCEKRGYNQIIAVIGDSDNTASIKLHEQHGFAMAGVLKDVGYKHNRWVDSVFMQRMLKNN